MTVAQDETGVCKNLLQETAQRAGVSLPVYSTIRSGPGHLPVFTCVVEVAGLTFSGEAAKTKKQAEKNAAMAAWLALKQCELFDFFGGFLLVCCGKIVLVFLLHHKFPALLRSLILLFLDLSASSKPRAAYNNASRD